MVLAWGCESMGAGGDGARVVARRIGGGGPGSHRLRCPLAPVPDLRCEVRAGALRLYAEGGRG